MRKTEIKKDLWRTRGPHCRHLAMPFRVPFFRLAHTSGPCIAARAVSPSRGCRVSLGPGCNWHSRAWILLAAISGGRLRLRLQLHLRSAHLSCWTQSKHEASGPVALAVLDTSAKKSICDHRG